MSVCPLPDLEFENLKTEINDPQIHLKNIEIIRVEYAIEKNYKAKD